MTQAKPREKIQSFTATSGEVRVPNASTYISGFGQELANATIVNSLVRVAGDEVTKEVLRTINRALRGESEPARRETESVRTESPTE